MNLSIDNFLKKDSCYHTFIKKKVENEWVVFFDP